MHRFDLIPKNEGIFHFTVNCSSLSLHRNKSVASRLSLPDTLFLLDYVRPDLLMYRVIARALILWDDVDNSKEWIDAQVPRVVKNCFDYMGKKAEKAAAFVGLANFAASQMDVDPPMDSAERNADGIDKVVENSGRDANMARHMSTEDRDFDRQAVRQAHAHIVAGACFGMGLRFAGTGDSDAASAIFEHVTLFMRLRDESDPVSIAQRPEHPILDMCLGCSALALAMVMAGTGDLETFRLLRALRWKCDEDVRYGTHMVLGSAIGLLFLGGGTCTLGRQPEDIAALLMAFFPRFPAITSDNQYHLQALRHCYALAVKRRHLQAIDIDTNERVFVPIEVRRGLTSSTISLRLLLKRKDNMDCIMKLV